MAIYYLNAQIIGRSAGRSATGAAAYRAGERIHDERTGQTYDYTRRRGDIEAAILAPAGAPVWATNRAQLWNAVEKAERRGDAQLCREIVVALPVELDREQQREVVRAYVQDQFVSCGMVADVAIHRNPGNPHAHIMLTMREMGPEGFSSKKNREWNHPELLEQWREQWAVQSNRALERAGREERIDHRSLAEQGTDRLPQVHLGPHAHALEQRGIPTEKGEHNRAVAEHNAVVIDLEKARKEKRRQEAEKAVSERYKARVQRGWLTDHAEAVGRLEYTRDGLELTFHDAAGIKQEAEQQRRVITEQIQAIRQEGRRLDQAAEILGNRRQAAAEVDRLMSPLATVKRWLSQDARQQFDRAGRQLEGLEEAARRIGTTSEADLQEQQARWSREEARVPKLEEKAGQLSRTLELAAKALDGFVREHDMEHEREVLRKRQRSRDVDRGR